MKKWPKIANSLVRVQTHDQISLLANVTRAAVKNSPTTSHTSAITFWKHKLKTFEKINKEPHVVRYTFHSQTLFWGPPAKKRPIGAIWAQLYPWLEHCDDEISPLFPTKIFTKSHKKCFYICFKLPSIRIYPSFSHIWAK